MAIGAHVFAQSVILIHIEIGRSAGCSLCQVCPRWSLRNGYCRSLPQAFICDRGAFTMSLLLRPHEIVAGDYRHDQRDHESCSCERVHVGSPRDKSPELGWDNNLIVMAAIAAFVDADLALEVGKFFQAHQLRFCAALWADHEKIALLKRITRVFGRPSRHPRIFRLRHATPVFATVRRPRL
jgi:hypothetical protein